MLQSLYVVISDLNDPILDDEQCLILSALGYNPLPALQDYFLVFSHLRVSILRTLLLQYLIGNQSIQGCITALEDLFVGVDLADLFLDVIQNHPLLDLVSLVDYLTALGHV